MSARTLFYVGHIKPKTLARKCSWCGSWFSEHDRARHAEGAQITHGCCASCLAEHFPTEAA